MWVRQAALAAAAVALSNVVSRLAAAWRGTAACAGDHGSSANTATNVGPARVTRRKPRPSCCSCLRGSRMCVASCQLASKRWLALGETRDNVRHVWGVMKLRHQRPAQLLQLRPQCCQRPAGSNMCPR